MLRPGREVAVAPAAGGRVSSRYSWRMLRRLPGSGRTSGATLKRQADRVARRRVRILPDDQHADVVERLLERGEDLRGRLGGRACRRPAPPAGSRRAAPITSADRSERVGPAGADVVGQRACRGVGGAHPRDRNGERGDGASGIERRDIPPYGRAATPRERRRQLVSERYPHLFSPLQIGPVTARNRIMQTAHVKLFTDDGIDSLRNVAYQVARAKGGAGLLITGNRLIHPTSTTGMPRFAYQYLKGALEIDRKMTSGVHEHGALIFAQLNHFGLNASSDSADDLRVLWGPSAVKSPGLRRDAEGDGARGHRRGGRLVGALRGAGSRRRLRRHGGAHRRTAICCTSSSRRSTTSATTSTAARSRTGSASRAR